MTILCYHAVDDNWRSPLAVTAGDFESQAAWLAANRRVLDASTAATRVDRSGRLPRGETAITFDDGFRSVVQHALPALRRHGLPAMVFVVAETLVGDGRAVDWVDTPPEWPLETLSVDELRELEEGGVTVASHSYSHHVLTELGEAECTADLRRSREVLEDLLGHPVRELAYPRGFHAEHVHRAAAAAGFTAAFTLPEGPEPVGPLAIPRVGVYPGNDARTLRAKTSRLYLPLRQGPVYPWVRRVLKGSPPPTRRAG